MGCSPWDHKESDTTEPLRLPPSSLFNRGSFYVDSRVTDFTPLLFLSHPSDSLLYSLSSVAQWIRTQLPAQGTQVWALVGLVPGSCQARAPHRRARMLQLLRPKRLGPRCATREATTLGSPSTAMKSNCHSPRLEKGHKKQQRPVQPKKGKKKKKKKSLFPYLLLMRICSIILLFFHKKMNILRLSRVF